MTEFLSRWIHHLILVQIFCCLISQVLIQTQAKTESYGSSYYPPNSSNYQIYSDHPEYSNSPSTNPNVGNNIHHDIFKRSLTESDVDKPFISSQATDMMKKLLKSQMKARMNLRRQLTPNAKSNHRSRKSPSKTAKSQAITVDIEITPDDDGAPEDVHTPSKSRKFASSKKNTPIRSINGIKEEGTSFKKKRTMDVPDQDTETPSTYRRSRKGGRSKTTPNEGVGHDKDEGNSLAAAVKSVRSISQVSERMSFTTEKAAASGKPTMSKYLGMSLSEALDAARKEKSKPQPSNKKSRSSARSTTVVKGRGTSKKNVQTKKDDEKCSK